MTRHRRRIIAARKLGLKTISSARALMSSGKPAQSFTKPGTKPQRTSLKCRSGSPGRASSRPTIGMGWVGATL